MTGGLAGLTATADEVYRRTYPRVAAKTRRYYERYPEDRGRIARLADFIAANNVLLPDGDRLSVRRLQSAGIDFCMTPGFENIHWLVDEAFSGAAEDRLSDAFLASVMNVTAYDGNPLFALLQESIYGQGSGATGGGARSRRVPGICRDLQAAAPYRRDDVSLDVRGDPFTETLPRRGHGPGGTGKLWTALRPVPPGRQRDPGGRGRLFDDMYVDAGLSLETAALVGNVECWVTNEYEHDGVRQSPQVFRRRADMIKVRGGPHR